MRFMIFTSSGGRTFASQLGEGAKDIMLTMALPTLLLVTARWRPHWLVTTKDDHDRSSGD